MTPGHDAAPDSQGPRPRWAAGHDSGQEVRLKCIVCVRYGWRRCSSVSPWSPRRCGGGGDEGGDTSGGSGAVQQGGTLNYAADQEPTGFNNDTSKDNGTSVYNIVINMFPQAFHAQPDFTVKMDDAFLDSAEQTSEDPQTIVYKIKQDAVWSDDTPITADDFIYFWEQQNGTIKDNDVASTTGYDQIESVEGSDNGKTVTVVFKEPYSRLAGAVRPGILPAHYI